MAEEREHSSREVVRLALERTGSESIRELSEKIGVSVGEIYRFQDAHKPPTYQGSLALLRAAGLLDEGE